VPIVTERRLELAAGDEGVDDVEVLDAVMVGERGDDVTGIAAVVLEPSVLEQRNLFGEAERIAGRAASAGTRRQYASIFRAFGDWLAGKLGRPPAVGDLDADVIAPTLGIWRPWVAAAAAPPRWPPSASTSR